jgi:hypothetical protein
MNKGHGDGDDNLRTLKKSLRTTLLEVSGSATESHICRDSDLMLEETNYLPKKIGHKLNISNMHKSTLSISSLKAVSKYSNGVYRDNKKKGCRFSIGPNDAFKEWNTG